MRNHTVLPDFLMGIWRKPSGFVKTHASAFKRKLPLSSQTKPISSPFAHSGFSTTTQGIGDCVSRSSLVWKEEARCARRAFRPSSARSRKARQKRHRTEYERWGTRSAYWCQAFFISASRFTFLLKVYLIITNFCLKVNLFRNSSLHFFHTVLQ